VKISLDSAVPPPGLRRPQPEPQWLTVMMSQLVMLVMQLCQVTAQQSSTIQSMNSNYVNAGHVGGRPCAPTSEVGPMGGPHLEVPASALNQSKVQPDMCFDEKEHVFIDEKLKEIHDNFPEFALGTTMPVGTELTAAISKITFGNNVNKQICDQFNRDLTKIYIEAGQKLMRTMDTERMQPQETHACTYVPLPARGGVDYGNAKDCQEEFSKTESDEDESEMNASDGESVQSYDSEWMRPVTQDPVVFVPPPSGVGSVIEKHFVTSLSVTVRTNRAGGGTDPPNTVPLYNVRQLAEAPLFQTLLTMQEAARTACATKLTREAMWALKEWSHYCENSTKFEASHVNNRYMLYTPPSSLPLQSDHKHKTNCMHDPVLMGSNDEGKDLNPSVNPSKQGGCSVLTEHRMSMPCVWHNSLPQEQIET
jgi:hypothetical protein